MTIDIEHLTESELLDLNHRIVHRLRFMRESRAHSDMLRFKIGDRVFFRAFERAYDHWHADTVQQEIGDSHYSGWASMERRAPVVDPGK